MKKVVITLTKEEFEVKLEVVEGADVEVSWEVMSTHLAAVAEMLTGKGWVVEAHQEVGNLQVN